MIGKQIPPPGIPTTDNDRPTIGKVYAVEGPNPGDFNQMRFTVIARSGAGQVKFANIGPAACNHAPGDYDVRVTVGDRCPIAWDGNVASFWIPWLPEVTPC